MYEQLKERHVMFEYYLIMPQAYKENIIKTAGLKHTLQKETLLGFTHINALCDGLCCLLKR
jgi:hypothetical protein